MHVRFGDGLHVCIGLNIARMEGEVILTQPLFVFRQQGVGPDGEVVGAQRRQRRVGLGLHRARHRLVRRP